MNKRITINPLVAIVLAIIFLGVLGWTFKTGKDNIAAKSLHAQDLNIIKMQDQLLTEKAELLNERGIFFKKIIAAKDAEIADINKLLRKNSDLETNIKTKNKVVYEKIKMDTSAVHQLQYTSELLADYDELFGAPTN